MDTNGQNCTKNEQQLPEMDRNWPKQTIIDKIGKNGQNRLK